MKKRLLFMGQFLALTLTLLVAGRAQASVALSSANFPDATFRAAVSAATGVSEGSTITDAQIAALTTLDVSNKGITSLRGLGYLTGLTYLNISDNNTLTTGADITGLTALKTLKASNCNIRTLAAATVTWNSTVYAGLTLGSGNSNIEYLDLSYNPRFMTSGNLQYLSKLETLLLKGCTYYDYWAGAPGNGMTSLKYLDISDCPTVDRIYLRGATQLKHINAAGTKVIGFSSSASTNVTGTNSPTAGYIVLAQNCPLEYLNLSDCSALKQFQVIYSSYKVTSLDTLIVSNTPMGWSNTGIEAQTGLRYLDMTNAAVSTSGSYVPNFDKLTKLETLLYGENPNVGYLRLTGNSVLTTLDVHGNTGLTMIALDNCGLPRTNLTINDTGCTALTGLKLNNNGYGSVAQAMSNAATWGLDDEHVKFLYLQNNSGFTGGALTLGADDCGTLTGLDLGNNGFTSFNAPSLPKTLTALMLGKNTAMTRLEMHNNPGITKMTADTVMSDGSGLYLLGNTALTYMDISGTAEQPNYFQRIGNNSSMKDLPVDTLKASYNKFYTFRNLAEVKGGLYETFNKNTGAYGTYTGTTTPSSSTYYSSYWPTMSARPDSASLEHLTQLRYLDLSHCQLKDSVYLHKNTELRYLDVSHNRTIARYTTSQDKGAGYRASDGGTDKTKVTNRDYPDYKKYLWLANTNKKYPSRQEAYDQEYYTLDYNDTTGLYILDLLDNNKLEYLDISYTGIQQTAMTHCHVANARYVWVQDLPNLKYFYADYNGMRSLGVSTKFGKKYQKGLESLERLSAIGMRGADINTMQGSINLHGEVCTKLHYVNLSYGDYDSIGVGLAPALDTLIIAGNPLHYVDVQKNDEIVYIDARECAYKMRGYDPETGNTVALPVTMQYYKDGATTLTTVNFNGARAGGSYDGAVQTPFSGLRAIRAYNRPELTTVLLNKSNALRDVYCHHDPKLPKIDGFDDLAYPKPAVDAQYGYPTDVDSLNLVWVNNDAKLIELNLTKNVNLHYLHAYNDKALGDALGSDGMMLNTNANLITAWVSNSNLQAFSNGATTHLDTLKIWQNPELSLLNVTSNTGLKWFDLRNCMISELDMSKNTQLTYFDCSNLDSIAATTWTAWDNYGYTMPRQSPTSMTQPGKNSIADLNFGSTALQVVRADNNDLYSLKGLKNNAGLTTLTYSHNHINGIDLNGCGAIAEYDCSHNVRGLIPGELSTWTARAKNSETNGYDTTNYRLYYFQLKKNAGDALLEGYDTFLGHKCGQDTVRGSSHAYYQRELESDGFDPAMVNRFTVNASGPYVGTRTSTLNAIPTQIIDPSDESSIDLSTVIGTIAVVRKYDDERNYVEYTYKDGRTSESLSTFGLVWYPPSVPTEVEELEDDGMAAPTVVSERYYDVSGVEHSEPVSGLNIIVRQMSDGTTLTVKVMK